MQGVWSSTRWQSVACLNTIWKKGKDKRQWDTLWDVDDNCFVSVRRDGHRLRVHLLPNQTEFHQQDLRGAVGVQGCPDRVGLDGRAGEMDVRERGREGAWYIKQRKWMSERERPRRRLVYKAKEMDVRERTGRRLVYKAMDRDVRERERPERRLVKQRKGMSERGRTGAW